MKKYIFSLILFSFFATSCEKVFVEAGPNGNNQEEVFDEFWNTFNEKYAMFEFKDVDWQAEYDRTRPTITASTSDDELFEIMGTMVQSLRDGHSDLADLDRDTFKSFNILKGAPVNFDIDILGTYLNRIKTEDFQFFQDDNSFYATLEGNIGYVLLPTFNTNIPERTIDSILIHFKDTKGLILDVRMNTGGLPDLATRLAAHFTDKEVATGFERFKIGPGENEFKDSPASNIPSRGEIYTKPVMVLTNGLCYSATTTLIYQTNPLDHVKFIGSRTGGGSGSVADGFLSNGWRYSLSVSEFIDHEGRHLDDGFDPDIEVFLDEDNLEVDEVIERAIAEIN
ncbi:MAG: S41 family peptidase [Saprospiraceae bacterium]